MKVAGWVPIAPKYLDDIQSIRLYFTDLKSKRYWFYIRLLRRK